MIILVFIQILWIISANWCIWKKGVSGLAFRWSDIPWFIEIQILKAFVYWLLRTKRSVLWTTNDTFSLCKNSDHYFLKQQGEKQFLVPAFILYKEESDFHLIWIIISGNDLNSKSGFQISFKLNIYFQQKLCFQFFMELWIWISLKNHLKLSSLFTLPLKCYTRHWI